jgi:hypothetical protein
MPLFEEPADDDDENDPEDFDDRDMQIPEEKQLDALHSIGFTDENYEELTQAIVNLSSTGGGLAVIRYYAMQGPSVYDYSTVPLTVFDQAYRIIKDGDDATALFFIKGMIEAFDKYEADKVDD